MTAIDLDLKELRGIRTQTMTYYRQEASCISEYVRQLDDGRWVVARRASDKHDAEDDPADRKKAEFTSTAFACAHLAAFAATNTHAQRAGRLFTEDPLTEDPRMFAADKTPQILDTMTRDFLEHYVAADVTSAPQEVSAAGLPNGYNSPIHLCGLAAAIRFRRRPPDYPIDLTRQGLKLAIDLARMVAKQDGFVYRSDFAVDGKQSGAPPNAYLSYWCIRSLVEWRHLVTDYAPTDATVEDLRLEFCTAADGALKSAVDHSIDQLSRIVTAHHAGVGSIYDAVDLVCTACSVGLASRLLEKKDEFVASALRHTLEVLSTAYVHSDGSFAPKSAVMTSSKGYGLIPSSAELASMLLHGLHNDLEIEHVPFLVRLSSNVWRGRGGQRGWGRGARRSPTRRPAFAACGAITFLRDYYLLLDSLIARTSADELGVVPFIENPKQPRTTFPDSVRDMITSRVIAPIKMDRRDLAVMSFVLGGPPGTGKTTIAQNIATELRWPLLVLDQGSFLRDGIREVESRAEHLFGLLLELSDTVVLFDEIEEMVGDRDVGERAVRILTTSMLPRIHRLRDGGRIIFIIATNYPGRIDAAASRPGRIDAILNVDTPQDEERATNLDYLLTKYRAPQDVIDLFREMNVVSLTRRFTFGYLKELVKSSVGYRLAHDEITRAAVEDEFKSLRERMKREQQIRR